CAPPPHPPPPGWASSAASSNSSSLERVAPPLFRGFRPILGFRIVTAGSLAKAFLDICHRVAGRRAADHAARGRRSIGVSCGGGAVRSARDRTTPAACVPNRSRTPAARRIVDARCGDARGRDRVLAPLLTARRAVDSSPVGYPRRRARAARARRLVDRRSSVWMEARRHSRSAESGAHIVRALAVTLPRQCLLLKSREPSRLRGP